MAVLGAASLLEAARPDLPEFPPDETPRFMLPPVPISENAGEGIRIGPDMSSGP